MAAKCRQHFIEGKQCREFQTATMPPKSHHTMGHWLRNGARATMLSGRWAPHQVVSGRLAAHQQAHQEVPPPSAALQPRGTMISDDCISTDIPSTPSALVTIANQSCAQLLLLLLPLLLLLLLLLHQVC